MDEAIDIETGWIRKVSLLLVQLLQVPAFVFYGVFLFIIIRDMKHLGKARFFNIFVSVGIADMMVSLISNTDRWLVTYCIGYNWPDLAQKFYLKYVRSCMWTGFVTAQLSGMLLMTTNRFTALIVPIRHAQIWSPKSTLIAAVCANWLPSVLYVIAVATNPLFDPILPNCTNRTCPNYFKYETRTEAFGLTFLFNIFYITLAGVVCGALYACMLVSTIVRRLPGAIAKMDEEMKAKRALETKLAMMVLINILIVFVYITFLTLVLIVVDGIDLSDETDAMLWPIVHGFLYANPFIDLVAYHGNPVLLMVMSTVARERVMLFVGWSKLKGKITSGKSSQGLMSDAGKWAKPAGKWRNQKRE